MKDPEVVYPAPQPGLPTETETTTPKVVDVTKDPVATSQNDSLSGKKLKQYF